MKRYIIALICILGFAMNRTNAMDYETARRQAYYLTDKMAYELNLSSAQYDDIYEINLDYLLQLSSAADVDAIYLTYRNEDIRYILHKWQWAAFRTIDYFYRPVRWLSGAWFYPVYHYYRPTYYYYSRPTIYLHYRGGHGRHYMTGHRSYYHNRRPKWNGGMRSDKRHVVTAPDKGHNNRIDSNPGRGDRRPKTESTGRPRPTTHDRVTPSTTTRRGNDMRSSSRTTVSGGRSTGRGANTTAPTRSTTPTRNAGTPGRSVSTSGRGTGTPARNHSTGSSRSGSGSGSRSGRR